jgi:hypothetical protein
MAESAGHDVSTSRVDDLAARAERARALLSRATVETVPTPDPGLNEALRAARCALNPVYARRLMREDTYRANYGNRKARDGRASGWKNGQPQCPSCRRILATAGGWCPDCRTYGGNHDHGGTR